MFVDYNGDYNLYIKNSGSTLPRYIVIINNYEVFSETYEDYVETVSSITREGERYGITFIITATGVNAVRGKTSQNFSNKLCLSFNNSSDYSSILGSTHGMVPSTILGRGLVKINGELYEFQTAYPCKWDEINNFIKETCYKMNKLVKIKAKKIAILPKHVRLSEVLENMKSIQNVPIGIEKSSLEISLFDFSKSAISLISAQDISFLDKFVCSLIQVLQMINNVEVHVIDVNEIIKNMDVFNNYYGMKNISTIDKLEDTINLNNEKIHMFLFFGFDAFRNSLTIDNQIRLKNLLSQIKLKNNVKVIIADSVSKLKPYEYEEFYRENVQPIYGIWVGSGINEQYTIKSSTYTRETRSQIENDFGYNVDRGISTQIKLLDFYTE